MSGDDEEAVGPCGADLRMETASAQSRSSSGSSCETPWHRFSLRIGLQGKMILCFMALLSAGLGGSCYVFISQSRDRIADLMGEQARQLSYSLSLASRPAMMSRDLGELNHIGQDLLKSRNILYVAYLDAEARPLTLASRDPDFPWDRLAALGRNTQMLMQVRGEHSDVFGEHIEIIAPILSLPSPAAMMKSEATGPAEGASGARLMGYVALGMSQAREEAQLQRTNYSVLGLGCFIMIASLPAAYVLVRRVFAPIRQLVTATQRIAAGELDAQVDIDRADAIGTLARSFNEMVQKVKSQQEALEEANHDLETKVLQRTAQLEAANQRLSSEIAEKEDFLRAVSHDLSAPLRNISGMATMLLMKHRETFDEDIIHRLQRIQKNVEVEADLISELLELSRIKTRRQKLEVVETQALVQEIAELFENDLKSRQISLRIDGPLPALWCERTRLRQVFQNLIDNAIKYMGAGARREIQVGCELRPSEAEFFVRDTGLGIDPEDVGKVFFVFRRGKNGAAGNVPGKGVGLASVKSIIETYSGSIWVESQPGEGSTFRFTINGQYVPALGGRAEEASGLRAELAA